MKLFALPDGVVDRFDRAQWLSPPFDLAWGAPVVPGTGPIFVDQQDRLSFGVVYKDRLSLGVREQQRLSFGVVEKERLEG